MIILSAGGPLDPMPNGWGFIRAGIIYDDALPSKSYWVDYVID